MAQGKRNSGEWLTVHLGQPAGEDLQPDEKEGKYLESLIKLFKQLKGFNCLENLMKN